MALVLSCPDCRTEFRTRELPPGTGVACPACGSRMVIPGLPVGRPLTEPDPAPHAGPEPIIVYHGPPRRRRINPLVITVLSVVPLLIFGGGLLYLFVVIGTAKQKPEERPVAAQPTAPDTQTRRTQVGQVDAANERPTGAETTRGGQAAARRAEAIQTLAMVVTGVACYFLPSIIALLRGHSNLAGVVVLNLFLGWTGWFWVLALVWAVWRHAPRGRVHYRD